MGEKINHVLSRPVYVYLYGIAFLVFKTAAYFPSFDLLTAVNYLFLFFIVTYSISFLLEKQFLVAAAPVIMLTLWISVFHVVGVAQLAGYSYAYIPLSFYGYFYAAVAAFVILIALYARKLSFLLNVKVTKVINVFLLMVSLVFLLNGVLKYSENRTESKKHFHSINIPEAAASSDIVWILMDEYASSESLAQQFGFKNPLDSILRKENFIILSGIQTRFANTLFSVNSIFNGDDSIVPSSYYKGIDLLRHGSLIPALEKSGYRFVNLGFFDMAQHPMIADRSGYPYTYRQQLFSGTLISMVYNHFKSSIRKSDAYNQRIQQKLTDTVAALSNQPRFIWAHLTIPHEPFCRNASGQVQNDTAALATDSAFFKRKYIGYLQYGNSILASLIEKHPEMKNKIVIISGDHGPRFPFLKNKALQKYPYAAIHMPGAFDTTALQRIVYISQLPKFLFHHVSSGKKHP